MYYFTFTPPHLVRPASRPFSGKNFGAVCSGVVGVLLDELLPPPVPLARMSPADGRTGNGVIVVTVMAGIPSGSPARDSGADGVYVLLPLLQRVGGSAPLGSR
jgi:hypothetical protein